MARMREKILVMHLFKMQLVAVPFLKTTSNEQTIGTATTEDT